HGPQRPAGRGGEVDDMTEAALVLEGEVRRVVQVDVRLRGTVDQQRPGPRAVPVGDELGESAVDVLGDGLRAAAPSTPAAPGSAHAVIVPGTRSRPLPGGAGDRPGEAHVRPATRGPRTAVRGEARVRPSARGPRTTR